MAILDKEPKNREALEKDSTAAIYGEAAHAREDSVSYELHSLDEQKYIVSELSQVQEKLTEEQDRAYARSGIALAEQAFNTGQRAQDQMITNMKNLASKAEMQVAIGGVVGAALAAEGLQNYKDTMQDVDPSQLSYLNTPTQGMSNAMFVKNTNKNNDLAG